MEKLVYWEKKENKNKNCACEIKKKWKKVL